eukprot:360636-Chlamydomonas_euryale.AAC.3
MSSCRPPPASSLVLPCPALSSSPVLPCPPRPNPVLAHHGGDEPRARGAEEARARIAQLAGDLVDLGAHQHAVLQTDVEEQAADLGGAHVLGQRGHLFAVSEPLRCSCIIIWLAPRRSG